MKVVIDCSFIMSSILPDENGSLHEYVSCELHVPAIFFLECNNVLLTNLQRKRITEANYAEYIGVINQLPLYVDMFSASREAIHIIGRLAQEHQLTAYDASYLELALRINAHAITLDKSLQRAYHQNQIKILT